MSQQRIRIQDLFGAQRELAELIGLDNYIKLSKQYGGTDIYIQKYSEVVKIQRNAEIREKYNGFNSEELAKQYDLSVRYVKFLCADLNNRPLKGQLSLFD